MLQLSKQVELRDLTTFAVDSIASDFIRLDSLEAATQSIPLINQYAKRMVLGGGSNVLFVGSYEGLIIYPQIGGIELLREDQEHYYVSVGASENWHQWVLLSNQNGWFGLENLALIPGTVGAAPVQNIGAYGVEVQQFIERVECIDLDTGSVLQLSRKDCQFAYRDSLIKQAGQGKYLVTRVEFKLLKQPSLNLSYAPLKELFKDKVDITTEQVIKKVCQIRLEKLPDPVELPNAGSFFKNPVIDQAQFEQLSQKYPEIVAYPLESGVKLAAGWLIDKAGLKGMREENVGVHRNQALVLVNYHQPDGSKIWRLAQKVQNKVFKKYGVKLEPEVRIEGGDKWITGNSSEVANDQ